MIPIQPLPFDASLEQYTRQANELLETHQSGNEILFRQFQEHLQFRRLSDTDASPTEINSAITRQHIARFYGFENWPTLAIYTRAVNEQRAVWQFESAIDAIIQGDITQLGALLLSNPALIRLKSMRIHNATLLHYLAATGVEPYRQQSAPNAIAIAQLLLKAGAEVDALANIRGKSTTLGLVVTSEHPWQTGIRIHLLEMLLNYGASVDGIPGSWSPLQVALTKGQLEATKTLVQHGARIDSIVTAARLGQLDLVQYFFCRDNLLSSDHTPPWGISEHPQTQAERALHYACLYGHRAVAEFLLAHGVDTKTRTMATTVNSFSDN